MDKFRKIYSHMINEDIGDNFYTTKSNVNVTVEGLPNDQEVDDYNMSVEVKFDIEVEHRSWGIKNITVQVHRHGPIEVLVVDSETMDEYNPIKTFNVELDFTRLRHETNTADYITVGDLELVLDYDGNVNYERSYIEVYSI